MAKKQKSEKNTFTNVIIIILAVLAVAAISCGVFALVQSMQPKSDPEQDNAQNRNTASDILKTEEDLKDENKVAESSNDAKDRMDAEADAEQQTTVQQDQNGLKIAEPVLNFVAQEGDQIVAGGAIPNINETGGTCTYVFKKGDMTITASASTLPNPTYISCETARIDRTKFTTGVWSVKIEYKSSNAEGQSEEQNYTVQ